MKYLMFVLILVSSNAFADTIDTLEFQFGRVLFNENQEAIGFEKTDQIPIKWQGVNVMYGLLVISQTDEVFTLDSVHTIPTAGEESFKVIGKSINMKHKAAIFMKTQQDDIVGDYTMEVFIDGRLIRTINYQLIEKS